MLQNKKNINIREIKIVIFINIFVFKNHKNDATQKLIRQISAVSRNTKFVLHGKWYLSRNTKIAKQTGFFFFSTTKLVFHENIENCEIKTFK